MPLGLVGPPAMGSPPPMGSLQTRDSGQCPAPIRGRSGVHLGSTWCRSGAVDRELGSNWARFGFDLGPIWVQSGDGLVVGLGLNLGSILRPSGADSGRSGIEPPKVQTRRSQAAWRMGRSRAGRTCSSNARTTSAASEPATEAVVTSSAVPGRDPKSVPWRLTGATSRRDKRSLLAWGARARAPLGASPARTRHLARSLCMR